MIFKLKNTWVSALVCIIYYVSVVLPHNIIGKLIGTYIGKPLGRPAYNFLVLSCGLLVLFISLLYSRKYVNKLSIHQTRFVKLYGLLTLLIVVVSFNVLLVVNIEIIHFIQYAILALLLFPLLYSYSATMWWGLILGFVDEFYQFHYLSPNSNYFDFNDVFIDQVGLAIGLIVLYVFKAEEKTQFNFFARRKVLLGLTSVFSIVVLLATINGFLSWVPDDNAVIELIRKDKIGFWREVPPSVTFHVMRPLEGLVVIFLAFCLYLPLRQKPGSFT